MKYLFLLYADENGGPAPDTAEGQAEYAAYGAFFEEVNGKGKFLSGDPVQPSATAKTVTVRGGKTDSAAGPARPDGEQLIGFYVLDVADENEAIELAAKIPAASRGRVEARPILVFP